MLRIVRRKISNFRTLLSTSFCRDMVDIEHPNVFSRECRSKCFSCRFVAFEVAEFGRYDCSVSDVGIKIARSMSIG